MNILRSLMLGCSVLVGAVVFSATAAAEPKLDRPTLEKYFTINQSMDALAEKYPDLDKEITTDMMFSNKGKDMIKKLKGTPAYKELDTLAKQHGLSADEVFNITSRLVPTLYVIQMEEAGADMPSIAEQKKMLAEQTEQLKSFGVGEDIIQELVQEGAEMIAMQEAMHAAAARVSEADRKAVREQYEWIQQQEFIKSSYDEDED